MVHSKSRLRRLAALTAAAPIVLVISGSAGASAPFPVHVRAANGVVTIPQRPTRIVSISPTATEDLYAVGAGRLLVAVDAYSDYPPQAPRTSLSADPPNVEAIAKYRPDLVVVADDADNVIGQLAKLHIPTLEEPPAANLGDAYAQLDQLGLATTGSAASANAIVGRLRAQVSAIVRSVPRPRTPITVYTELEQDYFSATSHTFIGQIYALLGLKNIADAAGGSNPYPQLSAEYIVAADPDLIVLTDTVCCGQSLRTVAGRPGWGKIEAVKLGAVVAANDSIASRWGPRIVIFIAQVAAAVKKLEGKLR